MYIAYGVQIVETSITENYFLVGRSEIWDVNFCIA